jgi:signal peptidase I
MERLLDTLQNATERFLTWRSVRRQIKKDRQKRKHPVVDWLEAFLWAAGVVLLINQYLLQAYQIPSSSMMNTLLISDRIFVDKVAFGPELLPGIGKLPGFAEPKRGQVIIFENPSYISRGPVFDVIQRVLYMATLSIVDIDRDEKGNPKAHFLIKRAVGMGGDRIRFRNGNLQIIPPGGSRWMTEDEFQKTSDLSYTVRRLIRQEDYSSVREAGYAAALQDTSQHPSDAQAEALKKLQSADYVDGFAFDLWRSKAMYSMNPQDRRYGARWRSYEEGVYIPPGRLLPLGDNRDNSRDGRFFGHIPTTKVLGKAMFKYWPLGRVGLIQ